jgi:hypothetical protein
VIATHTNTNGHIEFPLDSRDLLARVYGASVAVLVLTNAYSPATDAQRQKRRTLAPDAFGSRGARTLRRALSPATKAENARVGAHPEWCADAIGFEQFRAHVATPQEA